MKSVVVMVVEDDLPTSIVLCKSIRLGIPDSLVLTAYTLAEARMLLLEYGIGFVILDVNLPDGSGIEFIDDVTVANPNAVIVLTTSTPLPEYCDQEAGLGLTHFMTKPVECNKLIKLIQESSMLGALVRQDEKTLFDASLTGLNVLDIIQLKCLNHATHTILFKSIKHGSGRVCFQNGDIIHAETAGCQGMVALSEIIRWEGGYAEELPDDGSPPERTITANWQSILLTAAHFADDDGKPAEECFTSPASRSNDWASQVNLD